MSIFKSILKIRKPPVENPNSSGINDFCLRASAKKKLNWNHTLGSKRVQNKPRIASMQANTQPKEAMLAKTKQPIAQSIPETFGAKFRNIQTWVTCSCCTPDRFGSLFSVLFDTFHYRKLTLSPIRLSVSFQQWKVWDKVGKSDPSLLLYQPVHHQNHQRCWNMSARDCGTFFYDCKAMPMPTTQQL